MFEMETRPLVRIVKMSLFYGIVFGLFGAICFPIFWVILSSFKLHEEIFTVPIQIIPSTLTLIHYQKIFNAIEITTYLKNSLIVASGTSLIAVAVGSLAAYSLTRFPFKGIKTIAQSILFSYMLPSILLSIPFYIMLSSAGLINSKLGLMFCHIGLVLPFVIWLFWGFFRTIPIEIEEAAKIDGAGRIAVLKDVFFPLALPGIVAGGVFSFIVSWSDYLFSSVIATKETAKTLPVGIAMLAMRDWISWEMLLPAMSIIVLPVLIIMIFVQRTLLEGFSAPVVKG